LLSAAVENTLWLLWPRRAPRLVDFESVLERFGSNDPALMDCSAIATPSTHWLQILKSQAVVAWASFFLPSGFGAPAEV
jgi:hypothetical protein